MPGRKASRVVRDADPEQVWPPPGTAEEAGGGSSFENKQKKDKEEIPFGLPLHLLPFLPATQYSFHLLTEVQPGLAPSWPSAPLSQCLKLFLPVP